MGRFKAVDDYDTDMRLGALVVVCLAIGALEKCDNSSLSWARKTEYREAPVANRQIQEDSYQNISTRESYIPPANLVDFDLDFKMKRLNGAGSDLEKVSFISPENRNQKKTEYHQNFRNPALKINGQRPEVNYNIFTRKERCNRGYTN